MDLIVNPEEVIATDCLFLDTQFVLGDPKGGYSLYLERHIPNAIFVDLDGVLCGEITEKTGRHPLPDLKKFVSFLEQNGIDMNNKIVVYDNGGGGFAARLWWMLRTLGFEHVAVLNGGIDYWVRKGFPIASGTENVDRTPVILHDLPTTWQEGLYPIIDAKQLKKGILNDSLVPIDSRNHERYLGLEKGPDFMAGRIPKALNLPWGEHLDNDGKLLPKENLKNRFSKIVSKQNVFYCGSGVTACFNVLLAEWLGFGRIPLYPGSWSEWIRLYPDFVEVAT
ncbi:MAG: sulfurtransferase [Methanobacteriota archaeon]|nr:MAG: sulfurtransferase [Euryarchaeota archaeon]